MTETQFMAADPAHSVWLAAHAGTGKTKVLIDRILRLLLQGEHPASILAITYTKAAAQEMQLRLRSVLSDWAVADDARLAETLAQLLARAASDDEQRRARQLLCQLLDAAQSIRIQTIHAFCQSLLARFPLEAGVAPHFTLMDDRTARELMQEARQRLFAKALDEHDSKLAVAMAQLAAQVGDETFGKLMKDAVNEHAVFAQCFERAQDIDAYVAQLHGGLDVLPHDDEVTLIRRGLPDDEVRIAMLREAVPALLKGGKRMQGCAQLIAQWLESEKGVADFRAYARSMLKSDGDPMQADYVFGKTFIEQQPEMVKFLLEEQARMLAVNDQLNALHVVRFSAAFAVVVEGMLAIYTTLKSSKALVDYDDMIHACYHLLKQEDMCGWVMEKLDHRIAHLLLDEAQDTSPMQWDLMRLLKEELFQSDMPRSLFVVGDRKQSIYSFQGADPQGFEDNRTAYGEWFAAIDQSFQTLTLDVSFRSSEPVLRAVDAVFASDEAREGVSLQMDSHQAYRRGQAGCVALWPLLVADKVELPKPWEVMEPRYDEADAVHALAEQISERIAGWLREGRRIASQGRAIRAGDVMVLFQRRSPLFSLLARKLKQKGVAVAGADRIRLGSHIAVDDVVALANFCLFPDDDLTLASVLKTPWFDWDEEALFALAHGREGSCWQRLQDQPQWGETLRSLQRIREAAQQYAPHEWLVMLLEDMGGRMACKRRFGDEVDELFDELLSQALVFEASHIPSLQAFVHWLRAGDNDIKRELEHGADAVRIMTVHSAKGLQGRVVILPDTTHVPTQRERLWWMSYGGQGLCYTVPSGAAVPKQLQRVKQSEKASSMQEYRRLLYVAMTRAEDELYVCGSYKTDNPPQGCWYQLVRDGLMRLPETAKTDAGELVLEQPQTAAADVKPVLSLVALQGAMPDWVALAPQDEPPVPAVLRPSDALHGQRTGGGGVQAARAKARGTMTHQLLQWLPAGLVGITREHVVQMAAHFAPAGVELPLDEVAEEVWQLVQNSSLADYFGADSRAEVSLGGRLFDRPVPGQIDRLLVRGDEVHIVDFKTNAQPPQDAPEDYVRQLAIYRALMMPLYPAHRVRCFLLWTRNAQLMEIDAARMDTHMRGGGA